MVKLILFVLPLGLDTFAVSAALGIGGVTKRRRLQISLLLSSFEAVMPLAGLVVGRGLGAAIGGIADYVAAAALLALGGYMVLADEEAETTKVAALSERRGLALLGLGLSISLDELAMGFTIGLVHLPIVWAVVLIGVQAFLVAQLGLRLGSKLGHAAREGAEKLAAFALLGLGVLILAEQLT